MTDKTKPCPFCGSNKISLMVGEYFSSYEAIIRCENCSALIRLRKPKADDADMAVRKAWNKRAFKLKPTRRVRKNDTRGNDKEAVTAGKANDSP